MARPMQKERGMLTKTSCSSRTTSSPALPTLPTLTTQATPHNLLNMQGPNNLIKHPAVPAKDPTPNSHDTLTRRCKEASKLPQAKPCGSAVTTKS
ncbi:unnamed protein product [Prunus armeniaca]|uniref:Uncharacterized protein n=1 Tax=Prunus armeniaca TaxID=36596 RepID=A0A6J5Y0A3_PRUAR|nr:unnamed protein product [Prunus armeniaca]